jgi:hypothetical protein
MHPLVRFRIQQLFGTALTHVLLLFIVLFISPVAGAKLAVERLSFAITLSASDAPVVALRGHRRDNAI